MRTSFRNALTSCLALGLSLGLSAALTACPRAASTGAPPASASPASASAPGMADEQDDIDAASLAALVWNADSEEPSIWSSRRGTGYFVPRVGLRFVTPPGMIFEASLEPSQQTVLRGPTVPRSVRDERLYGDRVLSFRDQTSRPVVVSLLEIPIEVEPGTFCEWAAHAGGRELTVDRDEGERVAESTTRICDLNDAGARTRMQAFLRAGWLLVFEQRLSSGGSSPGLEALVATVRPFDDEG